MFTKDIARISVVNNSCKGEIKHGIELFSRHLQKRWGIKTELARNLVKSEFYDSRSVLLKAENFGKFVGVICIAPFSVINFPDGKEKDKLLCFFEEKKIKAEEVIHIGGLGLDHNNSIIDLTWWSRFLIFAALKVGNAQGWKYATGQSKLDDTLIDKIAKMFRFREISTKTFCEGVPEKWFLKSLA